MRSSSKTPPASFVAWLLLAACQQGPTATAPEAAAPEAGAQARTDVLAWVIGQPLTQADLDHVTPTGMVLSPAQRKNLLEVLIGKELEAQRARALGLDHNAAFQAKMRPLQARVDATARDELGKLLYREQVERQVQVSEEDVGRYLAQHEDEIRTERHLLQILRRDAAGIEEARQRLARGESFDAVAAAGIRSPPGGGARPWDLGFLGWSQVPEAWTEALATLEPGGISGVIEGPGSRYWIIQLVQVRRDETTSLAEYRPLVETAIRRERVEARQAELQAELRHGDRIEFTDAPPPAPED